MMHRKNAGSFRQADFRKLDNQIIRQIVSRVTVTEEMRIKSDDQSVLRRRDLRQRILNLPQFPLESAHLPIRRVERSAEKDEYIRRHANTGSNNLQRLWPCHIRIPVRRH